MWQSYQKLAEFPLSDAQAQAVREGVIKEVRRTVIGRKFIELFGPLGAGVEDVPLDSYQKDDTAEVELQAKADPAPIPAHEEQAYVRVPVVYKDFFLHWRDVQWSNENHASLDIANAVRAAHQVAHREDDLVFNGVPKLGQPGLLTWQGVNEVAGKDWCKPQDPVRDVYKAITVLLGENHHLPYAAAMSLDMFEQIIKPEKDTPVLELNQIAQVCTDGVFFSPMIPAGTAVVVSTGSQNFDLAVAEDIQVAYLGPQEMNYKFRVYESLTLRVKRPRSICVIRALAAKKG